jgi:hypothetical protein
MPSKEEGRTRIDRNKPKTDRALELLLLLQRSRFRIPLKSLGEDKWGSRKTLTRTVAAINAVWGNICGETLIEIVREDGTVMGPGERYLQLVDHSIRSLDLRRLAIYQAYLRLNGVLEGTIVQQMMEMQLARLSGSLLKSEQEKLKRMRQKFYAVMSRKSPYGGAKAGTFSAIFDALIDERLLSVDIDEEGLSRRYQLECLTLFSKSSQLYLMARRSGQSADDAPLCISLDQIQAAVVVTDRPIEYPKLHDPGKFLER